MIEDKSTKFNNKIVTSVAEMESEISRLDCSMIVTDDSGELLLRYRKALIQKGFQIKNFSLIDMEKSLCYNPFDYVYDKNGDIDEIKVNTIVNILTMIQQIPDHFWIKSARSLFLSVVYYMLENEYMERKNINFVTMFRLLQAGISTLDKLMDEECKIATQKGRVSRAALNYKTFKLTPGEMANSILISCVIDMQLFADVKVQNLTRTDLKNDFNNIHLEKIGNEKTALFIDIPTINSTFNFLATMLYSQFFDCCSENTPFFHVRCMMNSFAQIGKIPEFSWILSNSEKLNTSCLIKLKNIAELKYRYEKEWKIILNNCICKWSEEVQE